VYKHLGLPHRHVQGLVDSLICVGEHVTCPVVTYQAVPSTRRPPHLVIKVTIWPPAAGGILNPVPSLSCRVLSGKFTRGLYSI